MRIRARIFYWESNQSIRMITYRQDITKEKEREEQMLQMQLFTKVRRREEIALPSLKREIYRSKSFYYCFFTAFIVF